MSYAQPFPLAQSVQNSGQTTFAPDLAVRLICRDCQEYPPNIVEEFRDGDLVCGSCGLVLSDRIIDTRSEWREFTSTHSDETTHAHCRVGQVQDRLGVGLEHLATTISVDSGSSISQDLRRVARQAENLSPSERRVRQAFRDIDDMCARIQLPNTVLDITKQLYWRIDQENIRPSRLRSRAQYEATLGACFFIACRQARVPRTFIEICQVTSVDKQDIGRAYRELEQKFNLRSGSTVGYDEESGAYEGGPQDLLVRYCNYLGLPQSVVSVSTDVVVKLRELETPTSRSPPTIAGGAIFFASHLLGHPRNFQQIGKVAGMKGVSMAVLYKTLYDLKDKLVSDALIRDGTAKLDRLPLPTTR
ncbi:hypothetical protein BD309DRAFT_863060 [Dichomitus squalens]|uniref:General transcription factor TFIIB n=2 Tax=Dichomitus squalens TaxID=114155 RepID=A0A4V2K6V6_9APHY|nr:uncharacterized protein DICSQDRAFT_92561 [Dichomitus squalens LYAD-421 SS1]EJF57224.1 hypothetical protein DICSQDRAFT_92561 [Dichomitus squalens LYAD-421 SS1]TBU44058.1 hypothetical protein BD309DRAFT_863060 [Dichomitus squalens]TBU53683.1 hypothetical protein BD310DRAFT_829566 [Dichomitus squalens]